MTKLYFKFAILLEDFSNNDIVHHYGPVFTRWIPDGETDSISLKVDDINAAIKIWFSRMGFVQDGFIEFDYEKREVDPKILSQQAVLEAGPLIGSLELSDISANEINVIVEEKINDEIYIRLGKRIVNLLYPPIIHFIEILRINYGQYWIKKLHKWDSRTESLGNYCHNALKLTWSTDKQTWKSFSPTKQEINLVGRMAADKSFEKYITYEDWISIPEKIEKTPVSLGGVILVSAHQYFDSGNIKQALIEGVTCLEITVSEIIKKRFRDQRNLMDKVTRFLELPLNIQLLVLTATIQELDPKNVNMAIEAIKLRNEIVHEGMEPTNDNINRIEALLSTIKVLLADQVIKLPDSNAGNKLFQNNGK